MRDVGRKGVASAEIPCVEILTWSLGTHRRDAPTAEMLMQSFRVTDPVAVVATVCATLLLARSCASAAEDDDEVLEEKQLMEFYSKLSNVAAAGGPFFFFSCSWHPAEFKFTLQALVL